MTCYVWMAHRFLQNTHLKVPTASLQWLRQLIQVFLGITCVVLSSLCRAIKILYSFPVPGGAP
jgi:hypothetical protein